MVAEVHVEGAMVIDLILRNSHCSLVVGVDGQTKAGRSYLLEEFWDPEEVLGAFGDCDLFNFGRQESHHLFFGASSTNGTMEVQNGPWVVLNISLTVLFPVLFFSCYFLFFSFFCFILFSLIPHFSVSVSTYSLSFKCHPLPSCARSQLLDLTSSTNSWRPIQIIHGNYNNKNQHLNSTHHQSRHVSSLMS